MKELYYCSQVEEAENQITALNRLKSQLLAQLEDQRRQNEVEGRERQQLAQQIGHWQEECQQLRNQLEEEFDGKQELQRLISKANAEAAQVGCGNVIRSGFSLSLKNSNDSNAKMY